MLVEMLHEAKNMIENGNLNRKRKMRSQKNCRMRPKNMIENGNLNRSHKMKSQWKFAWVQRACLIVEICTDFWFEFKPGTGFLRTAKLTCQQTLSAKNEET